MLLSKNTEKNTKNAEHTNIYQYVITHVLIELIQ